MLSTSKSGGRGCHSHYRSRDRFRVNMMALIDVSCKKNRLKDLFVMIIFKSRFLTSKSGGNCPIMCHMMVQEQNG